MKAFDRIIGYSSIKKELMQISDILKNREAYEKLGVFAPRGLMLYGKPGLGKSLMADAVIEASERKVFCCRKDSPNGDFVKKIKATFDEAVKTAPSIVYLDDMDKFADGDERHPDKEEYVTIQSCIDETKDKQVFVLATVNNIRCLPPSLYRAGRFDRKIAIKPPYGEDAVKIISYYLESKQFVDKIDPVVIARIMVGRSCAELETVINEAGLYAGYERAESITMDHFLKACMHTVYNAYDDEDDDYDDDYEDDLYVGDNITKEADGYSHGLADNASSKFEIAYHEAGHAVISEVLCPGSVTIISLNGINQSKGGFVSFYDGDTPSLHLMKSSIVRSLGGIVAVERKYGTTDIGCENDLEKAFDSARSLITGIGISGIHLTQSLFGGTQPLRQEIETATSIEVERCLRKAREILTLNWEFVEKLAIALMERKLLSAIDVDKIKKECKIVPVAI